jgi:hypothetical protein
MASYREIRNTAYSIPLSFMLYMVIWYWKRYEESNHGLILSIIPECA